MDIKVKKETIISSLFWKLIERSGTQGIQFIVQIILARLLIPEQFGSIAIVMVFINLAQVFVQSGFNTALIQKKNADELDFSSVFYFSLFVAAVLYILLYLSAPFIAHFYKDQVLQPVLRVMGLTLFFGTLNSIQNAYVSRNMMFKKLFYSSIGAVLVSGIVGIIAAYMGFEIWALVIQQLLNQILITIIMWFTVKWRPKLIFSIERMKVLVSFGWKILASSLLNSLYLDLRTLIIGKVYTSSTLGYYSRGEQFPKTIVSNINGSIQSVMLPTLSAYQDNRKRAKEIMRRSIVTSSFLIFPMMIGMAVIAEPLVKIILTDKWLSAVPYLQVFCFIYALIPIQTANLQAINAMGRSDVFLKLEIIKKTYGVMILIISMRFGVYGIIGGQFLSAIISVFVNAYPNRKLLQYSYKEQWSDIMPALLISCIMGWIVYLFHFLSIPIWVMLIMQIVSGSIIYIGLARVFKIESFSYLIRIIQQSISLKNN